MKFRNPFLFLAAGLLLLALSSCSSEKAEEAGSAAAEAPAENVIIGLLTSDLESWEGVDEVRLSLVERGPGSGALYTNTVGLKDPLTRKDATVLEAAIQKERENERTDGFLIKCLAQVVEGTHVKIHEARIVGFRPRDPNRDEQEDGVDLWSKNGFTELGDSWN